MHINFQTMQNARIEAAKKARNDALEEAAAACESMRPTGGRAWTEGQEACFAALSEAANSIRKLKTGTSE